MASGTAIFECKDGPYNALEETVLLSKKCKILLFILCEKCIFEPVILL